MYKMMDGSFAKLGSHPYLVLAEADGMQLGGKFALTMAPIISVGWRLRVQWPQGKDLEQASKVFGLAFEKGSTPTNGSTAMLLPIMQRPAYGTQVREQFAKIDAPTLLATAITDHLMAIGVKPEQNIETLKMYLNECFDDSMPDVQPKPLESKVLKVQDFVAFVNNLK
jgi:hypothetical protein